MRPIRSSTSALVAAAATALMLTVSSCSSTATISKSELEQQAASALESAVGTAPDAVSCPGDLEAKVGASTRCTVTAGGEDLGATLTVTEVDGSNAKFDVKVDQAPS